MEESDWSEIETRTGLKGLMSCRCLVALPFPEILRRLSRHRLDSMFSQLYSSAWRTAPPSLLTLSSGNITENDFLLQRTEELCCFLQLQKKAQKVTPLSLLSECRAWPLDPPAITRHGNDRNKHIRKEKKRKRLEPGRKFPLLSSRDRSPVLVSPWREQRRCRLNFAWF